LLSIYYMHCDYICKPNQCCTIVYLTSIVDIIMATTITLQ